jgi:hypothetical protein
MADKLEHLAAELAAMLGRLDALLARSAALSAEQRTVLDEVDELVAAVNTAVETTGGRGPFIETESIIVIGASAGAFRRSKGW